MTRLCSVVAPLLGAVCAIASCSQRLESVPSASSSDRPSFTIRGADSPSIDRPVILSEEPWSYAGAPGSIIRTRHYRIYTTMTDRILLERAAEFLERALEQYRTGITPLPAPPQRLDTYLMANRPQWERVTRSLLGADARNVLKIGRGGFATRGIGVYYDLGLRDTLAVAAHEGWHQYTQRAFRNRLPVWLEEGLATYMEGHRWTGSTPLFRSWANLERYDQLRAAHAHGELLDLEILLQARPDDFFDADESAGLTYYAQVWALAHFLAHGADQRYRHSLEQLVGDASAGRLARVLSVRLGSARARAALGSPSGPDVFLAYFNSDLDAASSEYRAFINDLVAVGARDAIVAGDSPLIRSPR